MTYVVTENCIRCKYTDCVDVCPVDCFHEGPNFLVINPEECIDCNLCVDQCPVDAIYAEEDLPEDQKDFADINRSLSQKWPVINQMKPAPNDADHWATISPKKHLLDPSE
jgi:ferredoxin